MLLGEEIEDPEPFVGPSGVPRVAAVGPPGPHRLALHGLPRRSRSPWTILGIFVGFACGGTPSSASPPRCSPGTGGGLAGLGLCAASSPAASTAPGGNGFFHGVGRLLAGVIFFFAAPWVMRGCRLTRPHADAGPARARRPWPPGSAPSSRPGPRPSTPRRRRCGGSSVISTTAPRPNWSPWPCVSAWRRRSSTDGRHARPRPGTQLVDDAHRGAKEAIVELRDLARGIHPPALDIGLEGALSTLAARSTVPTELTVALTGRARRRPSRPSPTSAWPSCWPTWPSTPRPRGPVDQLRAAGDGCASSCATTGWAAPSCRESGSLVQRPGRPHRPGACRRRAAPHRQPAGGPTVVTVDLPLHA